MDAPYVSIGRELPGTLSWKQILQTAGGVDMEFNWVQMDTEKGAPQLLLRTSKVFCYISDFLDCVCANACENACLCVQICAPVFKYLFYNL